MTTKLDLDDPIAVLLAASEALATAGIEAAAYGGLALAVYGEPRETKDADLALATPATAASLRALEDAGLEGVISFDGVIFGGHLVGRIALVAGEASSGLNTVDLVTPRAMRYAQAAMDRAVRGVLRDRSLLVLTPEDFVIFKILSTRERDLEDALTVARRMRGDLDAELVDREIAQLQRESPFDALAARHARWRDGG